MDLRIAVLAALVGYLAGAISFARIVTRIVAPQQDINRIRLELPDSSAAFKSHTISGWA